MEQTNITLENFNSNNDFNKLKIIKLHFLCLWLGLKEDDNLLHQVYDNFYAFHFGVVKLKVLKILGTDFSSVYKFDNSNLKVNEDLLTFELEPIYSNYQLNIDKNITMLKTINKQLIELSSQELVNISYKWLVWHFYFNKSQRLGQAKTKIPLKAFRYKAGNHYFYG